MTTRLNPYLSFTGNARDAMTFYQSVFGGDLTVSTFADFHANQDPADADKVMHSTLTSSNEFVLMASDSMNGGGSAPQGYSLSVSGNDDGTLRGYWDKLVDGGTVTMPLEQAQWGDTFGMCTDRFGVNWMVSIERGSTGSA